MDLDELAQRHVEGRRPVDVYEAPIAETRRPIVIEEDEDGPTLPAICRRIT